jgi:hypothetical protein
MRGAAIAGAGALGDPGPAWTVQSIADLDGDTRADLVWRHTDGTAFLWRMNGAAVAAYLPLPNPGGTWQLAAP